MSARPKKSEQIQSAAQNLDGHIAIYPDLLAEVTNLVEWPSVVVGKISEFLSLPAEDYHCYDQRYFPFSSGQRSAVRKLL